MSDIDRDPKRKVSKPTEQKFRLGFLDGVENARLSVVFIMSSGILRNKK